MTDQITFEKLDLLSRMEKRIILFGVQEILGCALVLSFLVITVSVELLYPNPGRMTKRIDLTEMHI